MMHIKRTAYCCKGGLCLYLCVMVPMIKDKLMPVPFNCQNNYQDSARVCGEKIHTKYGVLFVCVAN